MATKTEYSQERELDEALDEILNKFSRFAALREHVKIGACFCIRTDDKDEGTVEGKDEPVALKKVPPDMQVFMKPKFNYVLVVDYGFWENAVPKQKMGYIHRALSRIKVDVADDKVKLSFRKWEIQDNIATLVDVGPYTENHTLYGEAMRKQLSGAQAALDRKKQPKEEAAEPEEPEPEPEEKPRVVARPLPKKGEAPAVDEDEPRRPARKVPPEPAKKSAPPEEPEPEPEDE